MLAHLPWGWILAGLVIIITIAFLKGFYGGRGRSGDDLAQQRRNSASWGQPRDVPELLCDSPNRRRIRLGLLAGQRIATPAFRSLMVIAPSGSGKTPRLVVPAVLEHQGPAAVTSVKADVLFLTRALRALLGPVWVFDPSKTAGATSRWSPLATVTSWARALDAAKWLQNSSKVGSSGSGVTDAKFWDDNARYFLAPLVFLAAKLGQPMGILAGWCAEMDPKMEAVIADKLRELELQEPAEGLTASGYWTRFRNIQPRTKDTITTTAFTVLEGWAHPDVAGAVNVVAGETGPDVIDLDKLLDTNGTLYLVAPASDQDKFSPVFETLLNALIMNVEHRAHVAALAIDPPLLLALDEAANIAPLRHLHQVASKSGGEGILLLSVFQDEGQIEHIYGPSLARTVVSNHYVKVYLPGISDQETLETVSRLLGTERLRVGSTSTSDQGTSYQSSYQDVPIATPAELRQMPSNEAIVIIGRFKPLRIVIPGWFEDLQLRALIEPSVAATFDNFFAPQTTPTRRTR